MVTLYSAQVIGLDARIINVEADISPGLHIFSIVGLADKEVQESRERIGVAIRSIGARPPHKKSERLIVNLAPADVRKEGPAFDLPIALGFLLASGQAKFDPAGKIFAGELGLDGGLKPVPGTLAMAITGRLAGFGHLYLPAGNGAEAALVSGLNVYEAPSLTAILDDLEGRRKLDPAESNLPGDPGTLDSEPEFDFTLIRGQEQAKRALEIAAAGNHNILLEGPPGTGKTILARALTSILPPMAEEEIIEATKIHSVAGRLKGGVIRSRPFRSPHHTASAVAITGGGPTVRPGEVTLAHRGVLFLDELAEFQPHVLEALRQPLEDRVITVTRAAGSYTFPAEFLLVAAMNPCPCGHLGNPRRECVCAPGAITRYRRRISGPLLDRIDLVVEVGNVDIEKLESGAAGREAVEKVRERIARARESARARFYGGPIAVNAAMTLGHIKAHCRLDPSSRDILNRAYEKLGMSVRSYYRTLKISRTIADLAAADDIRAEHVLEALQYRPRTEGVEIRD